jgi:hypothetical protein
MPKALTYILREVLHLLSTDVVVLVVSYSDGGLS